MTPTPAPAAVSPQFLYNQELARLQKEYHGASQQLQGFYSTVAALSAHLAPASTEARRAYEAILRNRVQSAQNAWDRHRLLGPNEYVARLTPPTQ